MKLRPYFSRFGVGNLVAVSVVPLLAVTAAMAVGCGGPSASPNVPESVATPIPNTSWSGRTASGDSPASGVTTSSHEAPAPAARPAPAPTVAPQATPAQPVPAGPCDACHGLVSSELQAALNKRVEQEARKCYERVLTNNPAARASLGVEIRVGRDGTSCDTVVQSDSPEWPGLADCVATEFRRGGFPNPGNNSCVIAKVPILFTPRVR
ncbi:hypothetical protein [Pendulispora albinea]|uniref:Uncharacterized protein n=1 Tax=Pendulispora albinea TaxID=2741071 RepID=A0ABZ2LTF4_9BACT